MLRFGCLVGLSLFQVHKVKYIICLCITFVFIGVIRKLKIFYSEVGHGHGYVDADIGTCGRYLNKNDITPDFDSFAKVVKTALAAKGILFTVIFYF